MFMFNPPHPSEIVRKHWLKALDLTVTEAAKGLGVTRKTRSSILLPPLRRHRRDGAAVVESVWERAGAPLADATCLPSAASPAPREDAARKAVLHRGEGRMEAAAQGDQSSLTK